MRQSWDSLEFKRTSWRCPLTKGQNFKTCVMPDNKLCIDCWKKELELDSIAKELRQAKVKYNDSVRILPIIILY